MRYWPLLCLLLGCQSLVRKPLPSEAHVVWVNAASEKDARKKLANRVFFLREIYSQSLLADRKTPKWSEDCLRQTIIPDLPSDADDLIHVTQVFTAGRQPGFCPINAYAMRASLVFIHCENEPYFLQVHCPQSNCAGYDWKQLCI